MNRRFALLLVGCFVALAVSPRSGAAESEMSAEAPVVAYYFHRTIRCQTCLTIEALARYDATVELAADIESGRLAWRSINLEEPAHAHFIAEFKLAGPSLVVARYDEGVVASWVLLDRVWALYDDVPAFDAYVLGAVEEYLEAASGEDAAGDDPDGD